MQQLSFKFDRDKAFVILILIGLSSGSSFYVLTEILKPSHVLPIVATCFFPITLAIKCLIYERLMLFLLLYILVALIYNTLLLGKDQLIDIYYIISLLHVYMAAKISADALQESRKTFSVYPFLAFAIILLPYLYELATGSVINKGSTNVPCSIFNNPNDLASYILIFIPCALFCLDYLNCRKIVKFSFLSLVSFWILLLGSRTCFLILPILIIGRLIFLGNFIRLFLTINLVYFTGLYSSQMNWSEILRGFTYSNNELISRTASRLFLFLFQSNSDNSLSYRLENYSYALNNFHHAVIGSGTKNYGDFYQAGFGNDPLLAISPHSFLIENAIAFGWIGILLITIILGYMCFIFLKSKRYRYQGLSSAFIFMLVSNVPSSIIRLPILFFPMFFFFHLCLYDNQTKS